MLVGFLPPAIKADVDVPKAAAASLELFTLLTSVHEVPSHVSALAVYDGANPVIAIAAVLLAPPP